MYEWYDAAHRWTIIRGINMSIRKETTAVLVAVSICALLLLMAPAVAFSVTSFITSTTPGGTNTSSFTTNTVFYVTVMLNKLTNEALNNVSATATYGSTVVNSTVNSSCAISLGNYSNGSLGYGYGYGYGVGDTPTVTCTFAFNIATAGTYVIDVLANGYVVDSAVATLTLSAPAAVSSSSSTTACVPSWDCTDFGTCSATGVQTRTCVDTNNCNNNAGKPDEVSPCLVAAPCVESWTCGAWGACLESGYQTRSCGDANHCGTYVNRPLELQRCNYTAPAVPGAEAEAVVITGGAEVTIKTIAAGGQQPINMPVLASTSTGVTKIVLSAKNAVANVTLTIKTAQPNVTAPDGLLIKYLDISATNLNAGDLDRAIISFQISKSQVQNVARVRLARYTGGAWVMLPTAFTGETSDSYNFEAETPGFSYFAVVEETIVVAPSVCTETCPAGQTQNAYPDCGCVAGVVPAKPDYGLFILVILLVIAAAYWWYSQKKPWSGSRK